MTEDVDFDLLEPGVKVYVITYTYQAFLRWCYDHRISRADRRVRYVNERRDLYGMPLNSKVVIQDWPERWTGAQVWDAKGLLRHMEALRG